MKNLKKYKWYYITSIFIVVLAVVGFSFAYFENSEFTNANTQYNVGFENFFEFSTTINGSADGSSTFSIVADSFDIFGSSEDTELMSNEETFEISLENKDSYNAAKCEFDYVWVWDDDSDNYVASTGATKEFTVSGPWGEVNVPDYNATSNVIASSSIVTINVGTKVDEIPITTKFYNLANVDQSAHAGKNYKGSVQIANVNCKQMSFCVKTTQNKLSDCLIIVDDYIEDLDEAKAAIAAKTVDYTVTEPTLAYNETHYERATSSNFTSTSNNIYYSTERPTIDSTGKFSFSSSKAIWGTVADAVSTEDVITYYTCMTQQNTCNGSTLYIIYGYRISGTTYYVTDAERYVATVSKDYVDKSGLYAAEDDYGTSYYYRGAVKNNYVKFGKDDSGNDMYWRIIRINGDGTIRMIYQGTSPTATGYATGIVNSKGSRTTAYNTESQDSAYVGYKYGLDLSDTIVSTSETSYLTRTDLNVNASYYFASEMSCDQATHKCSLAGSTKAIKWSDYSTTDMSTYKYTCWSTSSTGTCAVYSEVMSKVANQPTQARVRWHGYLSTSYAAIRTDENNSNIKTEVDAWYAKTFLTANNSYAVDANGVAYESYIADTLFCNDRSLRNDSEREAATTLQTNTLFGPYHRYVADSPSLICPEQKDEFTKNTTTVNGTSIGNAELDYSVGLITLDEVIMAGASRVNDNSQYYLYTGSYYWTMSPYFFLTHYAYAIGWLVYSSGYVGAQSVPYANGVRPVINLSSEVLISGGNGTADFPYEIAMPIN